MKIIETFLCGKMGDPALCEDNIVMLEDGVAVIDGVTTKAKHMEHVKTSGRIAVEVLGSHLQTCINWENPFQLLCFLNEKLPQTNHFQQHYLEQVALGRIVDIPRAAFKPARQESQRTLRCVFEPMLEDIEIVNFLKKYSSQILHMADCELGKNYLDLSDLALFADKNSLSMCKIAKSGNKVIGFATSFVISVKDLQQQIHLTAKNLPKFVKASEQICMIKTVVVDGNYQGKGVGYALIESLLTEWHSAGINDFACIAWKSKDGINIKGLLESFGFTAYTEIKDYWKEDSTNEGFDCPVCGNPCHCSAVIYFGAF